MRIAVFDVAAESGGALSVLQDFYNDFRNDPDNTYIFFVSKPELESCANIDVLRYPWIKTSWLHRLYFDYFCAGRLSERHHADQILSLQNVIVPFAKVPQTLYLHNSLPFVDYRFRLTENPLLWIYQNIISRSIFASLRSASHVIVQTKWMKAACVARLKIDPDKIEVRPPKIFVQAKTFFRYDETSRRTFFYPASAYVFKNHAIIIKACLNLKKRGIEDYKVILTIRGDENKAVAELHQIVKKYDLPVDFLGPITRDEVFDLYTKTVLLFPSFVESSPLPLSEAMLHGGVILASDYPFSREVLTDYPNARLFDPFNVENLANELASSISGSLMYQQG